MRSRTVLYDCRVALAWADEARTDQEFRVRWVALVALLRAVGHVLDKVDGARGPALRSAVSALWSEWQQDRVTHAIFWDFVESERNEVLKTYEVGVVAGDMELVDRDGATHTLDECLFKPITDGPFAGEDGRDVARDAISWWETQLSRVASAVGSEP